MMPGLDDEMTIAETVNWSLQQVDDVSQSLMTQLDEHIDSFNCYDYTDSNFDTLFGRKSYNITFDHGNKYAYVRVEYNHNILMIVNNKAEGVLKRPSFFDSNGRKHHNAILKNLEEILSVIKKYKNAKNVAKSNVVSDKAVSIFIDVAEKTILEDD